MESLLKEIGRTRRQFPFINMLSPLEVHALVPFPKGGIELRFGVLMLLDGCRASRAAEFDGFVPHKR